MQGGKPRFLLKQGFPDGFRVDTDGNVWTSAGAGIDCFGPEGDVLGRINFPQGVSNSSSAGRRRTACSSPARTSSTRSTSRRPARSAPEPERTRARRASHGCTRDFAATPLFADALDQEQLTFLASESRAAFFRAGTRLMNQGDFGGSMFVIVEGKVAVNFTDEERTRAAGGDARQGRRGR